MSLFSTRKSRIVVSFVLGLGTALLLIVHRLETGGDNLDFILLARSLQHGQWADVLGWPRPAGYSAFIAGLLKTAGMSLSAGLFYVSPAAIYLIKAVNVILYGLLAAAFCLFLERVSSPRIALAGGVLLALNQSLAAPASFIVAETLFSLMVMAVLVVAASASRDRDLRPLEVVTFIVLSILAVNVKYQGVALLGGLALCMLINRRWGRGEWIAAAFLGTAVALLALLQWRGNSFCLTHVVATDPYGTGATLTWAERLTRFAITYTSAWPEMLVPKLMGPTGVLGLAGLSWAVWPVIAVTMAIMVTGFVSSWRRCGFLLAHGFFLAFYGLLAIWPDFLGRYLLPIVPLGLWFLLEGLAAATRRMSQRIFPVLVIAMVSWCLAVNAYAGVKNWRNIWNFRNLPPWAPERYVVSREDDFADYLRAGEWLRDHSPTNALIFCRKALFIELAAGRHCTYYSTYASPDAFYDALRNAALQQPVYVLKDAFPQNSTYGRVRENLLVPALRGHEAFVERVHATAGDSEIYRVLPETTPRR